MKRLTSLALLAAAMATTSGAARADDIRLGYMQTSGGPFATFSKTNLVAAQMAVDEINAAGGVAGKKLIIVPFDTAGKPDQAVVVHSPRLRMESSSNTMGGFLASGLPRQDVAANLGVSALGRSSSHDKCHGPNVRELTTAMRPPTVRIVL